MDDVSDVVRGFRILKARLADEEARQAALTDEQWLAECSPARRAEFEQLIFEARQLLEDPDVRPAMLSLLRILATDPRAHAELRAAVEDGLRGDH